MIEIGFGGSNPRVNATWINPEGTNSCEVRGGRISPSTAGTNEPAFANINNTRIVTQTNGSTINFNIGLFNNPNIPFISGQTYGFEVRCDCVDGSGMSDWSGISSNSTFVVPFAPTEKPGNDLTKSLENFIDFTISPNPVSNTMTVQIQKEVNGPITYRISDSIGRSLIEEIQSGFRSAWTPDISSLPSGIYHLSLQTTEGIETVRFLITD